MRHLLRTQFKRHFKHFGSIGPFIMVQPRRFVPVDVLDYCPLDAAAFDRHQDRIGPAPDLDTRVAS